MTFTNTTIQIDAVSGDTYNGLTFTVAINGHQIAGEFNGEDGEFTFGQVAKVSARETAILRMLFTMGDPDNKVAMDADGLPLCGLYTLTATEMKDWNHFMMESM